MTPIEVLREHVERGAVFLDEHEPRWWKRIEEERLQLASGCDCVLGQLFEAGEHETPFGRALYEIRGGLDWDWAAAHGFLLGDHALVYGAWRDLDALWLEAIAQRKNQGDTA